MVMKSVLIFLVFGGIANAVNVALNKPTIQSSTYSSEGSSSHAVDGNTNGDFRAGSCSHTNTQNMAMWAVDLGKKYFVKHVEIFNRRDCCSDRLENFDIIVSDTKPGTRFHTYNLAEVCFRHTGTFHGSKVIRCKEKLPGRWVIIRFYDRKSRALTLCEVKVEADVGTGAFCHRANSDCSMHDVARLNGKTLDECKSACFQRQDCMSIQYNHKNECFIKDYACTDRELIRTNKGQDYIQVESADQCPVAFEYCRRTKALCPGHNIGYHTGLNREQCMMRCSVTKACRSVEHHASGNHCYLKNFPCANFEILGHNGAEDLIKVYDLSHCKYWWEIYD